MESVSEVTDKAIARAWKHADPLWLETATQVVESLASQMKEFTTDDVWSELRVLDVSTHEPRALGAVMKQAKKDGIIIATDRFVASSRVSNHGGNIRVWKSGLLD